MSRRLRPAMRAVARGAASAYAGWHALETRHPVSTDDAYVEGPVVVVSARVAGPVARVLVRDNEEERAGQVVVELDPRDYQMRADQARTAGPWRRRRRPVPASRSCSSA